MPGLYLRQSPPPLREIVHRHRVSRALLALILIAGCDGGTTQPPLPAFAMPPREGLPDLSEVTPGFREWGGAAMILTTALASDSALADLRALGVDPINDPRLPNLTWVYGGIPGDDATALVADRPYVTGIIPLHGPPYSPGGGPVPVAADSARVGEVAIRASLDRTTVPVGGSVVLTTTMVNRADTAIIVGHSNGCLVRLEAVRVLDDASEVPMLLDGTGHGCTDAIWIDTLDASETQGGPTEVGATTRGIPVPAGTYRVRVWWDNWMRLPGLALAFKVTG